MELTGQLYFRDASDNNERAGSGRKLMMVTGVVAVPEDTFIEGEHQYVVTGNGDVVLIVHPDGIDHTENIETKGVTLGSLLLKPIWHV